MAPAARCLLVARTLPDVLARAVRRPCTEAKQTERAG